MRKLVLSVLCVMLVMFPTIVNIPNAKSELYEEPSCGEEDGWETIYETEENTASPTSSSLPDLIVWRIDRRWFPLVYWRIRYWLHNTVEFTDTFYDGVWISDNEEDPYQHIIEYHPHNNELMWVGVNGPYRTPLFTVPHTGWWWITVYTDRFNNVEEENENNNMGQTQKYFWA